MKSFLILAVCAAVASAQQPAPLPTASAPQTPVRDSNNVALDRIVAVVGDQPITQFDIQERLLAMQQQPGFQPPKNQEEFKKLALDVANQLVDEELLVQKAKELKIEVTDQELAAGVDRQVRDIRSRFASDAEYRSELAKAGLGSPEEYRRFLTDQLRRGELQRRAVDKMKQEGKIPPANVSEADSKTINADSPTSP